MADLWGLLSCFLDVGGREDDLRRVAVPVAAPRAGRELAQDHQVEVEIPLSVDVKNLAFTSADPEGVIAWKGEEFEDEALIVHLEDNDLTDPIRLVFTFYSTARDNSGLYQPGPDATETRTFPEGLGAGSYTLHLNSGEWTVEPGLYTFDVEAIQTDICNTDAGLQIEDRAKYRSEHLNLIRGVDDEGNPIYDVYYLGYDDYGTPNEEDDDQVFLVRRYQLTDSEQEPASEGWIWLFDESLAMVYESSIGGLECLEHPGLHDGLYPGRHAIVVPIPASKMPYAGVYRFVLHVKDAHGGLYRNGHDRWALDLNQVGELGSYTVWMGASDPEIERDSVHYGNHMANRLERMGYKPYRRDPNDAEDVGTGRLVDTEPRLTIRTLYRLSPLDPPSHSKYLHRSAIWAYCGHGSVTGTTPPSGTSYLEFITPALASGIYVGAEYPERGIQMFSVDAFSLSSFLRFVYLCASYSGGGKGNPEGVPIMVSREDSIAHHFFTAGAHAVIGFREIVHPEEKPYEEFHKVFWDNLGRGSTVLEAYRDAKKASLRVIPKGDWNKPEDERTYKPFYPLRFGAENVIIKSLK